MDTFKHKFFGWLESDAYRWVNPDGSEGAIVAVTATVFPGLKLAASIEIGPNASIGPRASIGYGTRIGYEASIGEGASIGERSRIGEGASIGERARIGDGASIGDGARIERNDWHMTIGPQGSRNAMFTAVHSAEHGLRFWVGCKHGITVDEFRALVNETHGESDHAADYMHAIAFVETHPRLARHKEPIK